LLLSCLRAAPRRLRPTSRRRRNAEINPVTGHVLCIDPLGAAVEAPSPEAKLPCKRPEEARGQWKLHADGT
jgi:hypothetical protein